MARIVIIMYMGTFMYVLKRVWAQSCGLPIHCLHLLLQFDNTPNFVVLMLS